MSKTLKVAMIRDANNVRYFETEFAATTTAGAFVTFAVTNSWSAESTVDFNDYVLVDMSTQQEIPWNTWDILSYDRLGLYPKAMATQPGARIPIMLNLMDAHSRRP